MKINRHGRAKILTHQEIQLVFSNGLASERDKTLFGVCLFSACRIREACTLLTEDIYTPNGKVRPRLIIRKANTKGKLATRSIPVIEDLRQLLNNYYPISGGTIYCPGGGFGSAIIASKVTEIITAGVNDGTCEVLENPHIINSCAVVGAVAASPATLTAAGVVVTIGTAAAAHTGCYRIVQEAQK